MGYVIVPRRVCSFLFFSPGWYSSIHLGRVLGAINSVSLLGKFPTFQSTSSLETQAIKRILVASNGMAAAKVMMSMRQWAHMEVAVGPESRGKSVATPKRFSPPPTGPSQDHHHESQQFHPKNSEASPNKKSSVK